MTKLHCLRKEEVTFLEQNLSRRLDRNFYGIIKRVANSTDHLGEKFTLNGMDLLYNVVNCLDDIIGCYANWQRCTADNTDEVSEEDFLQLAAGLWDELVADFGEETIRPIEDRKLAATLIVCMLERLLSLYNRNRYYKFCDRLECVVRNKDAKRCADVMQILVSIICQDNNAQFFADWIANYEMQTESLADNIYDEIILYRREDHRDILNSDQQEVVNNIKHFIIGKNKDDLASEYVLEITAKTNRSIIDITKKWIQQGRLRIDNKASFWEVLKKAELYTASKSNFSHQLQ